MSNQTCSIAGCEREAKAKGLCKSHWQRARLTGDPKALGTVRAHVATYTTKGIFGFSGWSGTVERPATRRRSGGHR